MTQPPSLADAATAPTQEQVEKAILAYLRSRAYREKRQKQPHSTDPVLYEDMRAALRAALSAPPNPSTLNPCFCGEHECHKDALPDGWDCRKDISSSGQATERARAILERFDGHKLDSADLSQDSPWNVLLEEIAEAIDASTAALREENERLRSLLNNITERGAVRAGEESMRERAAQVANRVYNTVAWGLTRLEAHQSAAACIRDSIRALEPHGGTPE